MLGKMKQDVRKRINLAADIVLTQDEDVLDTWFSSALWPFSTLVGRTRHMNLKHFSHHV